MSGNMKIHRDANLTTAVANLSLQIPLIDISQISPSEFTPLPKGKLVMNIDNQVYYSDGLAWQPVAVAGSGGVWEHVTGAAPSGNYVRIDATNPDFDGTESLVFGQQAFDPATGSRLMFDQPNSAIRAGSASGTQWNSANRGAGSVAFGVDNTAAAPNSGVLGGSGNAIIVGGTESVICNGNANNIFTAHSFIGGGLSHFCFGSRSVIAGGIANLTGPTCTVGGGENCFAVVSHSTVAGGLNNSASSLEATVGGGSFNTVIGTNGTISGGTGNTAGLNAAVPGGSSNAATGINSLCCGDTASDGGNARCFVASGDASGASATVASQFLTKYPGGYRLESNAAGTTGVTLAGGAGAWVAISDRNKKDIQGEVVYADVLDALNDIPVYQFNYKTRPSSETYWGPMAQDWHRQFPCSIDPLGIDTTSPAGVSIAAIKGLIQQITEMKLEIQELKEKLKI